MKSSLMFKFSAMVALAFCLCVRGWAWDATGHRLTILLALEFRPELRSRLEKAIAEMPNSRQWRELKAGGFGQNARMDEKEDPDRWIKDLQTDLPKIAVFADWIRDYANSSKYSAHHYINLSYEVGGRNEFLRDPNAASMVNTYVMYFPENKGDQAWAIAWLAHLVGDLHQPLHCTARKLPDGQSDRGGNGVKYGNSNVHAFWDNLFDEPAKVKGIEEYAKQLYKSRYDELSKSDRIEFDKLRAKLNPMIWAEEGQTVIRNIGYPEDRQESNYDKAALAIAEERIVLSAARLADILDKLLPK